MRLDRMLSLCLVHPLTKMGMVPVESALPVLMYHSISDEAEQGVPAYYKTSTDTNTFERHMGCLKNQGFRSVSLDEGFRILQQGHKSREKAVIITFDDGFRDFYDRAFPILRKHGHTATVFLPTGFIGTERGSFKGRECLVWQEVRELRANGIRFGSHTVNHPKLYELPWNAIESELLLSKKCIEQELDEEITTFAYPYAFPQEDRHFVSRFTDTLHRHGYRNCLTTVIGRLRANDDPFRMKRLPANSGDDEALFTAKLEGAYDWLSVVQGVFRSGKACMKRARSPINGTRSDTLAKLNRS